ncbi:nucleotidyltransferase domain-containing protein [Candidatus Woesearchaeota archaeon]|nr:nucleotidyltransferase domain-containing protein [Candidatus Woesearchaeota archaeon]
MLEQLQNAVKNEKKDKAIFDIVLYGSAAKGKSNANDIDIAVIFREGSLKERLAKVQQIKKKIVIKEKLDVKAISLEELFQDAFFARSGIFLEGISLFDGREFSKKIGFDGYSLFVYALKNKTHTEKVKFNYVLSGRNANGMVKLLNGKHLAPGVMQIPIKNSLEFVEVLKKHGIEYSMKNVLISN